jgi:alpha-mannosidase
MDQRIIQAKLNFLRTQIHRDPHPLDAWSRRTATYRGPNHYESMTGWEDITLPDRTPGGQTVFYETEIDMPASKEPRYLVVGLDHLEGQLSIDDRPYAGVDLHHLRIPLPNQRSMILSMEFMSLCDTTYQKPRSEAVGTLTAVSIVSVDHEIEAFCDELHYAFAASEFCEGRRKLLVEQLIEETCLAVDISLPYKQLREDVRRARKLFAKQLAAIQPDPEAGRIFAVGHSHIDTAWLWPISETIRKCGRTFSTACRMIERHDNYYFSCSQPQHYAFTKQYYPDVYRQIKKWVAAGRWGTDGAMWVEPDCNVTSGESLVRQILYGLQFFRREFNTTTRLCWLPDVFGYNAALPQILKRSGIDFFYTYKLHWQSKNPFPYTLFTWRGLDGSDVTAHIPNGVQGYNGDTTPECLHWGWSWYRQKDVHPESLLPYGYGDGGGGPSDRMVRLLELGQKPFPGLPAVRTGAAQEYFETIEQRKLDLPVWDGELYLETHRGTLTTQGWIKRANRVCELLLRDAEILSSFAACDGAGQGKPDILADAWRKLCLHQFHDILPGSSIRQVYEDAKPEYDTIRQTAESAIDQAIAKLAKTNGTQTTSVTVFNTLGWTRNDAFTIPQPEQTVRSVIDATGTAHSIQPIQQADGSRALLVDGIPLPSMGAAGLQFSDQPAQSESRIKVTTSRIDTPYYRIRINKHGAITSLFDKISQRDVLEKGQLGNDLQLFQDGPETEDAWNIHDTLDKRRYSFTGPTKIEVIEQGPLRGVLRIHRTHDKSQIVQDMTVYAHTPRIDFATRAEWHQRQTLLKAAFPVAVRASNATYEIQFGAIQRPTHTNTSWERQKFEVAAHRWSDLSEPGYGVSLLNDCKYGHDTRGNVLRITLLRGTTSPDPQADEGHHVFTYSLLPHRGHWTEAGVVQRAAEMNIPPRTTAGFREMPSAVSFVEVSGPAILETIKSAEDGRGHIMRVYEPYGSRGPVSLRVLGLTEAIETNLVETDETPLSVKKETVSFDIKPFEIRTIRVLCG